MGFNHKKEDSTRSFASIKATMASSDRKKNREEKKEVLKSGL